MFLLKNNSGYIDIDEIRNVFSKGKNMHDRSWEELIWEVDINCDG